MVLVTGASGFLGSHILSLLLKKEKKIIALKRSQSTLEYSKQILFYYNLELENNPNIIWEEADLNDFFSIQEIFFRHKITEIYHCAGLISFEKKDYEALHFINQRGTAYLIDLALENKVSKVCHFSSVSAFATTKKEEIISETNKWKFSNKITSYGLSKYGGEREVWRGIQEGLNAVILNPSIIIGPGCWDRGSGKIISSASKGFKFYTPGGSGVVDVRDVTNIAFTLMERNIFSERFVLNSENLSFKEIFTLANKEFGHKDPKIKINSLSYRIAYYMERALSIFTGKKPILQHEFLKSGFSETKYSSDKIKKLLDYKFISASETFNWTCSFHTSK
ncbi:MAG: NAD-dependent epimerase/dehydratase family protein, partial [Bacteroidota bacterium]